MSESVVSSTALPPSRALRPPPMLHSGATLDRLIGTQLLAACFPLVGGFAVFGWRALITVLLVEAATLGGLAVWRRVSARGGQVRFDYGATYALLLSFFLPASVGRSGSLDATALWPIPVAAGLTLAALLWMLGSIGSGRVHPVIITALLLYFTFGEMLTPHTVLQRDHLFSGDVLKTPSNPAPASMETPWIKSAEHVGGDAVFRTSPAASLLQYTSGRARHVQAWSSLDALVRDQLPPLEDLMIGGSPTVIGAGSNVFVIIGGLFLLYCGLIDARVPLTVVLSMLIAMLILPLPVVIRENEAVWRWLPVRESAAGWRLTATVANYELFAGPMLLVVFFIANAPVVRPVTRRARQVYALVAGVAAATFQLYVSVTMGALLAVMLASCLSPLLDRFFRPRTLV